MLRTGTVRGPVVMQRFAPDKVAAHFDLYKAGRLDSTRPHVMGIGKQIRLPASLKAERLSGED
jgi:hypothetical protein